jgi:trehalose 6-phosphate synthase
VKIDLEGKRLVVVSNRLPVAIYEADDRWQIKPSPGGLVTALAPIASRAGGLWIGWPGCSESAPVADLLEHQNQRQNFDLVTVPISDDEIARYYRGLSNRAIWPLFHDLLGRFAFDLEEWETYLEVNQRFARVIADHIDENCILWVHDYQLLFVGHYLRQLGLGHYVHYFLHIPFPSVDMLRRMPHNVELLRALLCYDHVGFQTPTDHRNFINAIKWLIPEARRDTRNRRSIVNCDGREILTGFYPISIDFQEFAQEAGTREVADASWFLRENLDTRVLVLGLDRLDYTKGIPERFRAFERMLEKYPDAQTQISLLQVVIPSRLNVPDYQQLKIELDTLAGRINSRFSREGWVPIHYVFRELDRTQLLAHYLACEIALITPLRDGMNLVAKEFCASSIDDKGVLILSEFAGTAFQLGQGALLVNPYDIESTADAIYAAYQMPLDERRERMRWLRKEIKRYDVRRWLNWILGASTAKGRGHDRAWPQMATCSVPIKIAAKQREDH